MIFQYILHPPAKVKQQKLIHTIISQLYSLDDDDLDSFKEQKVFNKETLKYTIVTYEDKKVKYLNDNLQILNEKGTTLDTDGSILEWDKELLPFGILRQE